MIADVAGPLLALLVGLVLGLLGAGGSILAVPIFVYVLGYDAKAAVSMSLGVVGVAALIGFVSHWRQRHVDIRLAIGFSGAALIGTVAGVRLSRFVSGTTQLVMFAIVLIMASSAMWRGGVRKVDQGRPEAGRHSHLVGPGRWPVLGLVGIGVGYLTGMLGVGGGFLIVPALVLVAEVPMRDAVGTSLLVITINALSAFLLHLGESQIDWKTMGWFVALACVGIVLGSRLVNRVPQGRLKQAFSLLLVGIGVYMLYRR